MCLAYFGLMGVLLGLNSGSLFGIDCLHTCWVCWFPRFFGYCDFVVLQMLLLWLALAVYFGLVVLIAAV